MENTEEQLPNENLKEQSIFSEEDFSVDIYDKHIRQARNAIFACAGILLVSIIMLLATTPAGFAELWIDILFWSVFVIGFIVLGFWTKKKPYTAIVCALILYGLCIAINGFLDPMSIVKGIIFKIIIISLLVKGLSDAKAAEQMQDLKTK